MHSPNSQNRQNKADAATGSNGICRAIDATPSPSRDPKRWRHSRTMKAITIFCLLGILVSQSIAQTDPITNKIDRAQATKIASRLRVGMRFEDAEKILAQNGLRKSFWEDSGSGSASTILFILSDGCSLALDTARKRPRTGGGLPGLLLRAAEIQRNGVAIEGVTLLSVGGYLTIAYQPLDGLGSGDIVVSQVTCHDWSSRGWWVPPIDLISAPNVPPTSNPKKATEDLNLASVCGVRFYASETDYLLWELTLDATKFAVPQRFDLSRENIIRSCLECLRLCLSDFVPDWFVTNPPVTLKATDSDKEWLSKIVREFNAHDRRKVFYTPTR